LIAAGCGGGPFLSKVNPKQLEEGIRASHAPLVVLLWGDWSRASVELLPAAAELAAEYEGRGVVFYTVSLGDGPPAKDVRLLLRQFPAGTRHFILEEDPGMTLARLGLSDVPAALLYEPGGALRMALDSDDAMRLAPDDLADGIEGLTGR
jgi:hypothetical protein